MPFILWLRTCLLHWDLSYLPIINTPATSSKNYPVSPLTTSRSIFSPSYCQPWFNVNLGLCVGAVGFGLAETLGVSAESVVVA